VKFARKNATPATADQLRANAEPIRAEIERLKEAIREIPVALVDLAGDPAALAEAQAELREAQVMLPVKEAALAAIEAAIPVAEEREGRASALARRDDLERRTVKLGRNLEQRYEAASAALAEVLRDMEQNAREWEAVNRDLNTGEGGKTVEHRLRSEVRGASALGIFNSLTRYSRVVGWNGRTLFEGNGVNAA
jgi:DNA repair exonuclease SbcCD ATPase subunit